MEQVTNQVGNSLTRISLRFAYDASRYVMLLHIDNALRHADIVGCICKATEREGERENVKTTETRLTHAHKVLTFDAQVGGAVHGRSHGISRRDAHVFGIIRFDIEFLIRKI